MTGLSRAASTIELVKSQLCITLVESVDINARLINHNHSKLKVRTVEKEIYKLLVSVETGGAHLLPLRFSSKPSDSP
jgi:hypothetical protein